MSLTRRRIVDALFEEALDLPSGVRTGILDARCGPDRELRAEVVELLRLSRAPASTGDVDVDTPPREVRATATTRRGGPGPQVRAGDRVGRWRVLREIGRGGMGAVYLVERVRAGFSQRGALKLVDGPGRQEDVYRRLERERRILASLGHPHIARLLDGGRAADGRPYLVMEYVDGRPLDRYCDEARLTIDQRLDLFARVCAAAQHAHHQLVVHRDIKPSNIVVTADGHPMLLDFGIARLLSARPEDRPDDGPHDRIEDDGGTTGPAARILTPDYASPEQVRGDVVAIASDVYQLGLLLYELLTGARAQSIETTSPRALERQVCETEPVRPSVRARGAPIEICRARRVTRSALCRALRGDLDTLILCALRKEPDRRYGSVAEMLADVERYRHGAPLRARADNPAYRARKFLARHRVAVAWAGAALIALAAFLTVMVGARVRASREAAEARQLETLLAALFTVPDRVLTGHPPVALDYVRQAVELTRRQLADRPDSQARLLTLLGGTLTILGNYEQASAVLSEALALRVATDGADSLAAAAALKALGQSHHYLGRYDEAEASLRRVLSIRTDRLGPGHELVIDATLNLGDLLHTRGDLIGAERLLRGVVDGLRRRPQRIDQLALGLRDLANVLRDRGALDESAACFREAVALFTTLHGDSHVRVAETNAYFGRLLVRRGEFDEADVRLAGSLQGLRHTFGGDHPLAGFALRELGFLRTEQGRFEEAERLLAQAQAVFAAWLVEGHPMVPRVRAHQAELARRRGNPREAVRLSRLTLEEFSRLRLADHPSAIDAQLTLGQSQLALGRLSEARRTLSDGLVRARRQLVENDPRLPSFERALASVRTTTAGASR